MKSVACKLLLAIIGLLLSIGMLEIVLRVGGVVLLSVQEFHNRFHGATTKGSYRIMCLGESTTQNQYPRTLERILAHKTTSNTFRIIDKGVSGISTRFIVGELENNISKYKPDMIVVMMGINDFGDIVPWNEDEKWFYRLKSYRLYLLLWMHLRTDIMHRKQKIPAGNPIPRNDSDKETFARNIISDIYLRSGIEAHAPECINNSIKKAAADNPDNHYLWRELGTLCMMCGYYGEADSAFSKALVLLPYSKEETCRLIAENLCRWHKYNEATELLTKCIHDYPGNSFFYEQLYEVYRIKKDYLRCMQLLPALMAHSNPENVCTLVLNIGETNIASQYRNTRSTFYYLPNTCANYRRLVKIVQSKGIKLVCMQYPLRSVLPLKAMLRPYKNIIFVDNNQSFRDALKKNSFNEIFRDRFAEDFGHCTDKGNEIIAENLARAILAELEK